MPKRTVKLAGCLAAMVVSLAIVFFIQLRIAQRHALANIGRCIPQPSGYVVHFGPNSRSWFSETEQIVLRDYTVKVPGGAKVGTRFWNAFATNMIDGSTRPLSGLNARWFTEQSKGHAVNEFRWIPSPDGKWIAYDEGLRRRSSLAAISIDGRRLLRWKQSEGIKNLSLPVWMPDNHRFMTVAEDLDPRGIVPARMYDVERPGIVKLLHASHAVGRPSAVLGLVREGQVLAFEQVPARKRAVLTLMSFDQPKAALREHRVVPPRGGTLWGIALSPEGNRLAWLFETHDNGPRFLQRPLAYFGFRARDMVELWTSDIDGNNTREIGHIETKENSDPGSLGWSPSGKQVSFALGRDLWIVPVNQ